MTKYVIYSETRIATFHYAGRASDLELLKSFQKKEPESNWLSIKKIPEGKHLCKYCQENIVDGNYEDLLCAECKEAFGHSLYSEL